MPFIDGRLDYSWFEIINWNSSNTQRTSSIIKLGELCIYLIDGTYLFIIGFDRFIQWRFHFCYDWWVMEILLGFFKLSLTMKLACLYQNSWLNLKFFYSNLIFFLLKNLTLQIAMLTLVKKPFREFKTCQMKSSSIDIQPKLNKMWFMKIYNFIDCATVTTFRGLSHFTTCIFTREHFTNSKFHNLNFQIPKIG